MNNEGISGVTNSYTKNETKKQKLIAGIISGIILVLILVLVYIFFIKALEPDKSGEDEFLSLTDTKVVDLWNRIDHFSDWYDASIEPEYEKLFNEFYSLEKKTPNDFSDELKQFMGISSKYDYNDFDTITFSIPDFRDSMNTLFGTTGEINFVPFSTGECHFGAFSTIEKSLMLDVTRDIEKCTEQSSQLITELVTAQQEEGNVILEVQTGFVHLDNGIPSLYTNSSKTGQVSSNISEFNNNGDYTSALTSYKNNLSLYKIIFDYTGTGYRFSSIERIK